MSWKKTFYEGLKSGIPIGLGYLPVSFTFGFLAVSGGLPVWVAVFISLTNLTSAGQFAGTNLILAGAGYFEVALTTFVINLRYMLMSLSLSQKLDEKTGTGARLALAFGITDETFVVSSLHPGILKASYMLGLITMPILGWNLGTWLGGAISAGSAAGAAECDGNCPIRDVYCTDSAGGTQIAVGVLRHHSGSCDGVHFKICSGFCRYFLRFPGDSGYDRGIGVRCMEIPA